MDTPQTAAAQAFLETLAAGDLYDALAGLNATTPFRFTGVYRFVEGVVMNVVLYDRANPGLKIGQDVPLLDSYCRLTGLDGESCRIDNAPEDGRLEGHAARSSVQAYCAVLLRDADGGPLGTLCHFDPKPCRATPAVFEVLHAVRAAVEEYVLAMDPSQYRGAAGERVPDFLKVSASS